MLLDEIDSGEEQEYPTYERNSDVDMGLDVGTVDDPRLAVEDLHPSSARVPPGLRAIFENIRGGPCSKTSTYPLCHCPNDKHNKRKRDDIEESGLSEEEDPHRPPKRTNTLHEVHFDLSQSDFSSSPTPSPPADQNNDIPSPTPPPPENPPRRRRRGKPRPYEYNRVIERPHEKPGQKKGLPAPSKILKRGQRSATRRPRTRLSTKQSGLERIALHPCLKDTVMVWSNPNQYSLMDYQEFWEGYCLEGPAFELSARNAHLIEDTGEKIPQDIVEVAYEESRKRCRHDIGFPEHDTYSGSWPWRGSVQGNRV